MDKKIGKEELDSFIKLQEQLLEVNKTSDVTVLICT